MAETATSTGPHLHFEASRVPQTTAVDLAALAIAAGRLFQAVTVETIQQFTPAECHAWLAFTDALELRRFRAEEPLEDAVHVDPVRYTEA
jgi:murein DD-endopeptidase MepM/ murein hydrolase activator NlpD